MKKFFLIKVPLEATEIFINNVGCLRYSYNQGKQSTVVEPVESGIYLDKNKHKVVGDSFLNEQRLVVIEMDEW